eukprot:24432-Amphidinium_carterae.1
MTLRNRPDLVPSVIEHLKQLGCGTPAGLTAEAVAESQRVAHESSAGAQAAVKRGGSTASLGEGEASTCATGSVADGELCVLSEIPRKYGTFDALAV